ncbi:MAG: ATP-binding cassette domain-containing protein [Demequinaceae bacterium]|nr:ATP-binding cassette domain-containing protein [Demequinaceae bacterium]
MTEACRFGGVSLTLGENEVLTDVSWTVRRGEHWVVLGPNGAGKTSLLSLLAARSRPTAGTIEVLGESLGEGIIRDTRIRVGLASDAVAGRVFEGAQVGDVVLTASYGTTSRQAEPYEAVDTSRAEALLEAFGLVGLMGRDYGTLSEGERQRVHLARSLMPNPEILALDEPAAGLDLKGREELLDALGALASDPRSPVLILVTHRVEEIPEGFTHALLIAAGRVVASGPIAEALTAPRLSQAYGIPIELDHQNGRWSARRA